MYQMNPNLKLFFFIRDPVKRLYSQVTQIFRPNMAMLRKRLREYATPGEVWDFDLAYYNARIKKCLIIHTQILM